MKTHIALPPAHDGQANGVRLNTGAWCVDVLDKGDPIHAVYAIRLQLHNGKTHDPAEESVPGLWY